MPKPVKNAGHITDAVFYELSPAKDRLDEFTAYLSGLDRQELTYSFALKSDDQKFGLLEIGKVKPPSFQEWPDVIGEVSHFKVLGSVVPDGDVPISIITFIPVHALEGKSEAFEEFTAQGPERVVDTEPETYHWYCFKDQDREGEYAILDLYANEIGLHAHLLGEVAAELKQNAADLVQGGWKGVVSNATNYHVLAQSGQG